MTGNKEEEQEQAVHLTSLSKETKEEEDNMVTIGGDPSKPSKALMKTWGIVTRLTLIVYLCGSVLVYIAFSRDEVDACFGFCDHLTSKGAISLQSSPSYSNSVSRDAPVATRRSTPRRLPSFANGGVIFFLHVPKTGGISIRKALVGGEGKYFLSDDRRKFDRFKRDIASFVKYGTNGQVVTMEIHAASSPTLIELAERLRLWRKIAAMNDVPFFAFTTLREPLSFSTSWFNFFHGMDHGDDNYVYYETPTEQDFLDTAVLNPQCGFLVDGDSVFTNKRKQQMLNHADCLHAYDILRQEMDWVGTTSALSTETFPLLRSLVGSNTNADHLLAENVQVKNKSPKKIREQNLSPKAVEKIRKMTVWDQEMYEKLKRDFPFDQVVMVEEQTAL